MLDLTSSLKTKELRFPIPLFLGVPPGPELARRARALRDGQDLGVATPKVHGSPGAGPRPCRVQRTGERWRE